MTISYNVDVASLVLNSRPLLSAIFNFMILQTLFDRQKGSNKSKIYFG